VLIDALYLKDDVRGLGDLIERTGKRGPGSNSGKSNEPAADLR
jgi:hypothetical protein